MNDFKNKEKLLVVTSSFPKYAGDSSGNFIYELSLKLNDFFNVSVVAPKAKHESNDTVVHELDGLKIYRFSQSPMGLAEIAYGDGIMQNLKKKRPLFLAVPFFLMSQFFKIWKVAKTEKIELINAQWIPAGLVAILYKKISISKVKIVVTIHGTDYWGLNGFLGNVIKEYVCNKADRLVAVSEPIKQDLLRNKCKTPLYVCSMGTDTGLFSPLNISSKVIATIRTQKNEKVILFIGRLIKQKGVYTLIKAFSKLSEYMNNVRLILIGEGNIKNDLIDYCEGLGIQGKVIFLGKIKHTSLPYYLNAADVFVLPSLSEGFPLVVMEALSCGIPVVTSDIDTFKTHNNGSGVLSISRKEDADDLASSISKLLTLDEASLNKLKEVSRKYALENFGWDIVAKKYQECFTNL